jgi:FlaA1/EpsC-like NDP-sugar epimerase
MFKGNQQRSYDLRNKAMKMTVVGGLVFWAANFATSLTPLAAEYRAALSISYLPMIVESLLGGMIVSCCLSYLLLHFYDKIPARNAIYKSMLLSFVALSIASIMMYIAASRTSDTLSVLLIGTVLNVPRFLAIGLVIGYFVKKEAEMRVSV